MPCSEILRELDEGIDVLATPEPDLPERHRSVRDILDNTLSQLTTEERALAQRLADAPPDADASQVEMDTEDGTQRTPAEVLSGLRSLSEQALICVDATRGVTRLHPLLSCYVRSSKRGRRGRVRVA